MIEEADLAAVRVLPSGTGALSAFIYARLPELAARVQDLHALPARMRPALDPGARLHRPADDGLPPRIRLPAGPLRARPPALLAVLLRADRDAPALGAARRRLPILLVAQPAGPARDGRAAARSSRTSFASRQTSCPPRCAGPISGPRRRGLNLGGWFSADRGQAGLSGRDPDARAVADRARRHGHRRARPVPARLPPLRGTLRPAARARRPRRRALDARIHAGLRAACRCSGPRCCRRSSRSPSTTPPSSAI